MTEEAKDCLIYEPVSFISSKKNVRSSPLINKLKGKRRRKNAVAQIENPLSCFDAIQVERDGSNDEYTTDEFIDRKISTDSYLGGSDSPNDEEIKPNADEKLHHPRAVPSPTPSHRRLSEVVKQPDGSYVTEEQNIPLWQLREKTNSASFDYTIDELFHPISDAGNTTSFDSFNSTRSV